MVEVRDEVLKVRERVPDEERSLDR